MGTNLYTQKGKSYHGNAKPRDKDSQSAGITGLDVEQSKNRDS